MKHEAPAAANERTSAPRFTRLRLITLAALICTAGTMAAEDQPKGFWRSIASEPDFPAALRTDSDSFSFGKTSTTHDPLTFSPFKVRSFREGWRDADWKGVGLATPKGTLFGSRSKWQQPFSFTLDEAGSPALKVRCGATGRDTSIGYGTARSSVEATLSGNLVLECELVPFDQSVSSLFSLVVDGKASGVGAQINGAGTLNDGSQDYAISLLFALKGSAIGDVPAGLLFSNGTEPVAALLHKGSVPSRFVILKRATPTEKKLLAGASAAFVLYERMDSHLD